MGRGGKPRETNVPKIRTIYSRSSTEVGTGSFPETQKDSCLFSFILKIDVNIISHQFQINDPVALVPGASEQIDIFVKGLKVSRYEGSRKKRLLNCMADNYVYTGKVESVENENGEQILTALINSQGR